MSFLLGFQNAIKRHFTANNVPMELTKHPSFKAFKNTRVQAESKPMRGERRHQTQASYRAILHLKDERKSLHKLQNPASLLHHIG